MKVGMFETEREAQLSDRKRISNLNRVELSPFVFEVFKLKTSKKKNSVSMRSCMIHDNFGGSGICLIIVSSACCNNGMAR